MGKIISEQFFIAKLEDGTVLHGRATTAQESGIDSHRIVLKQRNSEYRMYDLTYPLNEATKNVVREEMNLYLNHTLEEARMEFPEWIFNFGHKGMGEHISYTIKELKDYWHKSKSMYGKYKLAYDVGLMTKSKPAISQVIPIIELELLNGDT